MEIVLAYDHRTSFAATPSALSLDFATNLFRKRVAFQGRVLDPYLFGQMLKALYGVAKSEHRYYMTTTQPIRGPSIPSSPCITTSSSSRRSATTSQAMCASPFR